mgnify:CR=1 FL=1|tara:strand:+ start:510 stop:1055 length:546 start_codon:yes stop_codon:yes gene_type:complete
MLNLKKNTIKNVCLVGLMGSGKTVIGKKLSQILQLNFIDTDYEIEKNIGKSIKEIFEEHGETFFRNIEEEICLKFLKNRNSIISLGGGSILNRKIRNSIKSNSYSIFINVNLKIILKRLSNSKKRPLLNNENKEKVLQNLYNERIEYYNQADLVIKNDLDKEDVINKIAAKLKKYDQKNKN